MALAIAMIVSYIPLFKWMYDEYQEQLKQQNKTH